MALREAKEVPTFILKFGGGLHNQEAATRIQVVECADGRNFTLDFGNSTFGRRKSIEAVASAPNGQGIRGFIQLVKLDGTRSFLVQAGDVVYEWDGTAGSTGMVNVGAVNPGARLRGRIEANSSKDDTVLIADLAQKEPVLIWDGTTLSTHTHNLVGDFFARYIIIDLERAIFANVKSGAATPHLVVASKRDDFTVLTTGNRPASGLGEGDAWFLPIENLKPINSLISAFDTLIFGTRLGQFFKLTGSSSKDYALPPFFGSSGSNADEGVVFVGNDIVYSKRGGVEGLFATEKLGNVEVDDLTRWLDDDTVVNPENWDLHYSEAHRKVYCIPENGGKVFVLHKSFLDARAKGALTGERVQVVSPWSVWETDHSFNFEPTAVMRMFRPTDGKEFIYMGGADGTLYQLEASPGDDLPRFNAVDYDGTNDYLLRGADLTGNADSKKGIISFFMRVDGGASTTRQIVHSTDGGVSVFLGTDNKIRFRHENSGGTAILDIITTATFSPSASIVHVLGSWDLGTANARHLHIEDVSDLTETTFTDDTIDYTKADHAIANNVSGTDGWDGVLAEVYINFGEYLDFSVESNRRKFIDASGNPVDLGTDGSTPTGNQPIVYLPRDFGRVDENAGSGGDFTINGSPSLASLGSLGATNVTAERLSGVFELPPGHIFDVNGWVRYSKTFGGTLTLTMEYGGRSVMDEEITVTLDAADNAPVFGGGSYFNESGDDAKYFGVSFGGRFTRSDYTVAGGASANQVQIRAKVTGTADFTIEEIGIQLQATTG